MTGMPGAKRSTQTRDPRFARTINSLVMLIVWAFAAISADPGVATQMAAGGGNSPSAPLSGQAQWKEFGSRSGKFGVLFPGIPEASKTEIMTPAGTVVSTRFTVRAGPGVTYDVMYNDYPKSSAGAINQEILLDAARDGLIHRTNGRLITEKTITLDGNLGREVEIRGIDATLYTVQLVLVDRRLYQVLAIDRKSKSAGTRKFLESFRVLRTP